MCISVCSCICNFVLVGLLVCVFACVRTRNSLEDSDEWIFVRVCRTSNLCGFIVYVFDSMSTLNDRTNTLVREKERDRKLN